MNNVKSSESTVQTQEGPSRVYKAVEYVGMQLKGVVVNVNSTMKKLKMMLRNEAKWSGLKERLRISRHALATCLCPREAAMNNEGQDYSIHLPVDSLDKHLLVDVPLLVS
jgi:hypothetical protein